MMNRKKIAKCAGAACAATGVVALSSLVASGAAVGAIVEGFKSAGSIMKRMLEDEPKAEQKREPLAETVIEKEDMSCQK